MKTIIKSLTLLPVLLVPFTLTASSADEWQEVRFELSGQSTPTAKFSFSYGAAIVNETYHFFNYSAGHITSYYWEFGAGEGTSSERSPYYAFRIPGNKTITLVVSGPEGTDKFSRDLVVYGMPPACHNYSIQNNMDVTTIRAARASGEVRYGNLVIVNDYMCEIKVEIYNPDEWLNGICKPWRDIEWNIPAYKEDDSYILTKNDEFFTIGEDWGIRITFCGSGVKSCIRIIKPYSSKSVEDLIYLEVKASDVYEDTKPLNIDYEN